MSFMTTDRWIDPHFQRLSTPPALRFAIGLGPGERGITLSLMVRTDGIRWPPVHTIKESMKRAQERISELRPRDRALIERHRSRVWVLSSLLFEVSWFA